MRDAGLSAAMLDRLVCPIGVPGVEGKDPAVIAASTAAQLLMVGEGLTGIRRRSLVSAAEFRAAAPKMLEPALLAPT